MLLTSQLLRCSLLLQSARSILEGRPRHDVVLIRRDAGVNSFLWELLTPGVSAEEGYHNRLPRDGITR